MKGLALSSLLFVSVQLQYRPTCLKVVTDEESFMILDPIVPLYDCLSLNSQLEWRVLEY